jgi:hypothetical protein
LPARGLPEPRFPGGDAMGPASANCKDASETPALESQMSKGPTKKTG